MNSTTNIKKLKAAKVKCLHSFEFFTRYFFKQANNRKFILNDHHKIIIDALVKVSRGEIKRLIINIAPRYSKTELAVKMFIAWCMARNAQSKFIHLSYSDTLALDNSEEVKDLITSDEFQQLFPNVRIKKDSKAKNKWYTEAGGGVLARSSSGQVTGFGAGAVDEEDEFLSDSPKFAGAIIIDDPIKPDDAHSETLRNKINTKFDSTIRSRTNSRNTPIIVVMQRVHEEDLSGYLQTVEPGVWTVISLPAIKEDGTALWDHKHTIEELRQLEAINKYVFETQYMQNPTTPEGKPFHKSNLKWFTSAELPDILKNSEGCISYLDPKDEGSDFYCHVFGHIVGNSIYVTDVIHNQHNTDITIPASVNKIKENNCEHTVGETNAMGAMVVKSLRDQTQKKVVGIHNITNKMTRISTYEASIVRHMIFLSDSHVGSEYASYIQRLTSFAYAENKIDDAPDATAGLMSLAMIKYKHLFQ